MKHHDLPQGSPQWHAHRRQHFNASDAPAMLGCSPYRTRQQLLHELHTGLPPEVDNATQRRFDDGHRYEALARPLAEKIIGEDLYPVVGSEGRYSASFDGLTMAEDTAFEHKSLNDDLRASLPQSESPAENLPKHYRVQMEQQLLVSGAERVLFMATKWNGEECVESRWCWYYADEELRAEIQRGWAQFEQDLADYVPATAAAVVVPQSVQSLPSVVVQVEGSIAVRDNFRVFEVALRDFLEHRLIRKPATDQDFADLDVQIKAMKGAEAALKSAEQQMLAQVESIDTAKRTKDMLLKLVSDNRIMAERLLKDEKERRRGEIVAGGVGALKAHIDGLNRRLGKPYLGSIPADFGGCIKGKSALAKMEDAVATELARAKIAANELADRISVNLAVLGEHLEHAHLFPDTGVIVLKAADDLQALVSSRISDHRAAEERRLEAQRERIRAEERVKLQQEQEARDAEERRQRAVAEETQRQEAAALERRQREEQAAQAEQQRQQQAVSDAETRALQPHQTQSPALTPAAGPAVIPKPTKAPAAPASPPTLKLGQINERLAPLQLSADALTTLGFPPAGKEGAAKLYHEHQFNGICEAIERLANTQRHACRAAA